MREMIFSEAFQFQSRERTSSSSRTALNEMKRTEHTWSSRDQRRGNRIRACQSLRDLRDCRESGGRNLRGRDLLRDCGCKLCRGYGGRGLRGGDSRG
jgi:hypothetical protein